MSAASSRPSNEDRIRAASWFAAHGFGVFPVWSTSDQGVCRCPAADHCESPGKHPITGDGFKSATTDTGRIATFLSAASQPNYGLVCPEGVFALDVDGDDIEKLADLERQYGLLPATLRTRTANGWHIFLRWPEAHPRPIRQLFGMVTRWGSGKAAGYVIGPRSVHHSGVQYTPDEAAVPEIATLPEPWAIAGVTPTTTGTVTVASESGLEHVSAGHRHEFLRDRARTLRGGGLTGDGLLRAVMELNEAYCDPPKSEEAVRRAIGDVETKFGADPVREAGAAEDRYHGSDDGPGILERPAAGAFPEPPEDVAFGGLVGECVHEMSQGTDASLVGLLASFLSVFGAVMPAIAYSRGQQTTSPFIALVGESGVGRKGTAMHRALDAVRLSGIGSLAVNRSILDGINSGEGLITALAARQQHWGGATVGFIFEDEFASLMQSRDRDGSTLDPKMRAAFDGSILSNRKVSGETVVNPPYWLPALTAITPTELRYRLDDRAARTGSANRWLYVPVERRDVYPPDLEPILSAEVQEALVAAWDNGQRRDLTIADDVSTTLSEYASFVIEHSHGVAFDLVKRYQAIAVRVAMIHATVERSSVVQMHHLQRALALTEYARRGFSWVFGQTIGNPTADLLLRYLQDSERLSANYITRHVERSSLRRQEAIDELLRLGYAETEVTVTRGRPRRDLVLSPSYRPFVPFVPNLAKTPHAETGSSWTKAPDTRSNGVDRSRTEVGQKSDASRTEVDERSAETVVDHSTGEVKDATATWAKPCSDYINHRTQHRRRPEGWVCLGCHPGLDE